MFTSILLCVFLYSPHKTRCNNFLLFALEFIVLGEKQGCLSGHKSPRSSDPETIFLTGVIVIAKETTATDIITFVDH